MKYFLLALTAFGISCSLSAQHIRPVSESDVKSVKVFLNGAQVNRELRTVLDPGTTLLQIENLSPNIDKGSISVTGTGDAVLAGVGYRMEYLTEDRKPAEVRILEDSARTLQLELDKVTGLEQVYNDEITLLNANKSVGGSNVGVDVDNLREVADFFRQRMIELRIKLIDTGREKKRVGERMARINQQLGELNAKKNRPLGTILVTMTTRQRTTVNLSLSYYIPNAAAWSPLYDIRAKDVSSPVQLAYKAQVTNASGESWDNVQLTLSTGNPSLGGNKPQITPWYLDFLQPYYPTRDRQIKELAQPSMMAKDMVTSGEAAELSVPIVQMNENQLATDFAIAMPYSLTGDGKPVTVDIQSFQLPATYTYYAAPRLDRDAFLLARVTGWDAMNLLPGPANVYFEGSYVGETGLDPALTLDTLDLSLGRDKRIVISREKKKEMTSVKTIGGNRVHESTWEIKVRNSKREPVELFLEDQFPVSRDKDIRVQTGDYSGASYDESTGKLTWKMTIGSNQTETRSFNYTVKYPKDRQVPGL